MSVATKGRGKAQQEPEPEMDDTNRGILRSIVEFTAREGFPPTVREVAEIAGIPGSATIQKRLSWLADNGYISRMSKSPRAIRVLREP